MRTRYDHIDLRVHSLAEVRRFYEILLPALGFTRRVEIGEWLQFEAAGPHGATEFLAETARQAGARKIEGPGYDEGPGYYAVFFEDPSGNRLEICHRIERPE